MTKDEWIQQPPIPLTVAGQAITLIATVTPAGDCCYKSEALEFWLPTTRGKVRVRGRIVLTAADSRHWPSHRRTP